MAVMDKNLAMMVKGLLLLAEKKSKDDPRMEKLVRMARTINTDTLAMERGYSSDAKEMAALIDNPDIDATIITALDDKGVEHRLLIV
jgi:hypothetical protein